MRILINNKSNILRGPPVQTVCFNFDLEFINNIAIIICNIVLIMML